jgi:hypothetical protein
MRNYALNARDWGIPNRPMDLENDFGGAIGGAVKIPWPAWSGRKKTYGFVNYEGFRLRGAASAPLLTISTAQERQGDFSDWKDTNRNLIPIYDSATTAQLPSGVFTRQQFMGCSGNTPNVICPSDPHGPDFEFLSFISGSDSLLFPTCHFSVLPAEFIRPRDAFLPGGFSA